MACDTFTNCVSNPLENNNLPAANTFVSVQKLGIYAVNFTIYVLYLGLIISVVYFIFKGIYAIIGADSSESYEKFRGALTNAVFAAVGIVALVSARFIFVVALRLIGIPDSENIFMDGPLNALFAI